MRMVAYDVGDLLVHRKYVFRNEISQLFYVDDCFLKQLTIQDAFQDFSIPRNSRIIYASLLSFIILLK